MRGHQDVAQCRRAIALIEHVAHGEDVAGRLRHLVALLEQQMLDMHPEPRERLAGGPFRLRDFVLVMRKDQIDAAGMNVDRGLA